MVKSKKIINFKIFLYTISFLLSYFLSSCNGPKAVSCSSITNDCIMTLTDSTDQHLVFFQWVKINNSCYEAKCIYTFIEPNPTFQLIKGKDTLSFERDALFICDTVADRNQDGYVDWIIRSRMSRGKMEVVYYFIPEEKRLDPIPDTIFDEPWEQDYFWSFDTVAYCIPIDSHRKIEFTELIVILADEEKRCDSAYGKPILIDGRDTISLSYDAEYEGAHIISPDKQKVAFLTRRCYWLGNVWIDREDCCILDLESKEFSFDKCGDGHFDNHNRWVCDGELMWVW